MKYRAWAKISGSCLLVVVLAMLIGTAGCGDSAKGDGDGSPMRVLEPDEAKDLLMTLPYQYKWRTVEPPKGATGALAGTATGRHHSVIHFGLALGSEAGPVAVPQSGIRNPYDYSQGGGFVFTDDIITARGIGKQIRTAAQWREANFMEVEMTQVLCQAATGEVCPP